MLWYFYSRKNTTQQEKLRDAAADACCSESPWNCHGEEGAFQSGCLVLGMYYKTYLVSK